MGYSFSGEDYHEFVSANTMAVANRIKDRPNTQCRRVDGLISHMVSHLVVDPLQIIHIKGHESFSRSGTWVQQMASVA